MYYVVLKCMRTGEINTVKITQELDLKFIKEMNNVTHEIIQIQEISTNKCTAA